jgi:hypothetical protein
MSKSHREVIKQFAKGREYRGHNVYAERGILYSYGSHFPLAVARKGTENLFTGEKWFLLNGDKYSSSTNKHQSITMSVFKDYPRVSFSALRAAGINYNICDAVHWTGDDYVRLYPGDEGFDSWGRQSVPFGGTYYEGKDKDDNIVIKGYHRIGGVILKQDGKYYLCAMDENSYFISLLPNPAYIVQEGYDILCPEKVIAARYIPVEVKRQGEWFFVPSFPVKKNEWTGHHIALPRDNPQSNPHTVTRYWEQDGKIFVSGTCRHSQHKMTKLPGVWEAMRNTAVGNWSASGNVD